MTRKNVNISYIVKLSWRRLDATAVRSGKLLKHNDFNAHVTRTERRQCTHVQNANGMYSLITRLRNTCRIE